MRVSFPLLSFVVLCISRVTASSTYNLYFDGILSPNAASSLDGGDNMKDSAPISLSLPPALLMELSVDFVNEIIHVYNMIQLNITSEGMPKLSEGLDAKDCLVAKDDVSCMMTAITGSCISHYVSEAGDMDVHVVARLQRNKGRATLSAEVMLTAPTTVLARETLIRMVPRVSHKLGCKDSYVWSIQHQPSVLETMESSFMNADTVIAAQELKERYAASIDELILGNVLMKNRIRLESRISTNAHLLELWSYEDVKFRQPVQSLFIDGYLATTTGPSGIAHAEALVHPAMVAHPSPKRALVISVTPNAIVKEILKYKVIEHVSVAGSDSVASTLIEKLMPALCDCGFLGPEDSHNCMEYAAVQVIEEDLDSWLDRQESFDVMFVDVRVGNHEWLSTATCGKIHKLSLPDSIIVVSSGSMPSLFDVDTEIDLSPRENLIRYVSRETALGGLYGKTLLYDEPLAQPLSSTYIIIIPFDGTSYYRFVRRNAPAVDVDLVNRLRPVISNRGHPTVVYDGPTHLNYLMISRAWEHWYCQTILGRDLPICKDFLPKWFDPGYHFNNAEVRIDPKKGRSLFTREDIPKGHFVLPQDAALGIRVERDQWEALNEFVEMFPDADMFRQFRDFVVAYGFESEPLERSGWVVSIACNNSFTNHACTKEEETTMEVIDIHYSEDGISDVFFSPPVSRRADLLGALVMTSRDVKAGEELAMDYNSFREDPDYEFKELLRQMCDEGVGLVHDAVIE